MIEIELLYKINKNKIRDLYKKFKIKPKEAREIDTYFYPPHKKYLTTSKGRENLRVRDSIKSYLTYKKVIYNKGKYSYSIEKDIVVSNPKQTIDILKSSGFRIHFIVDKKRSTLKEKNFQITIDNVKDLGSFVEIEWIGKSLNEEIIKEKCSQRAKELGLKKVQDKGYLRLLEEKKRD